MVQRRVIAILCAAALTGVPVTASASFLGTLGGIWATVEITKAVTDAFETCPPVHTIDRARGKKDLELAERYSQRVLSEKAAAIDGTVLRSDLMVANRCATMAAKSWPLIVQKKAYREVLIRNSKLREQISAMASTRLVRRGKDYIDRMSTGYGLWVSIGVVAFFGLVLIVYMLRSAFSLGNRDD